MYFSPVKIINAEALDEKRQVGLDLKSDLITDADQTFKRRSKGVQQMFSG